MVLAIVDYIAIALDTLSVCVGLELKETGKGGGGIQVNNRGCANSPMDEVTK